MNKVTRDRRNVKYRTAADWPSTPEIDGVRYVIGPDPAEAAWASESFNQGDDGHTTENPPDSYYDRLWAESEALSRIENGCLF